MRHGLLVLAIVVLVALAGCSMLGGSTDAGDGTATDAGKDTATVGSTATATGTGTPTATATSTATETEQRDQVEVVNGTPDVDATESFYRLRELTGSDVRPPTVRIRNLTERKNYSPGRSPQLSALGFQNVSMAPNEPGGLTRGTGQIFLYPGEGSSPVVEQVLVHEYVHNVQFRGELLPWLNTLDQPRLTTDLIYTRRMQIEGSAVFVTDGYTARHLDTENQSARMERRYQQGSASARLLWGLYHHGYEYTDRQIDSSENLSGAFAARPNTTEQILHDEGTVDVSSVPLQVNASAPTQEYIALGQDTNGEYRLRLALETELEDDTATAAATGWGNDTIRAFQHTTDSDRFGWVWTIRMDNESERAELAPALSEYAGQRSNSSNLTFEADRLDDETIALTFGPDAFVSNTTVTAYENNVTVRAGA